MDSLKQIMYGVTDFALMRAENAYFVDHTGLIREWNLMPVEGVTDGVKGGTVTLHRILIVFHGGDVAACEELA